MLNMNELYNKKNCQENYNKEPCSLTDLQKLFDNYMDKKESFEQVQKPAIKTNSVKETRLISKNNSVKKNSSNSKKMPIQKVKRESKKSCCFSSTLENPYLSGAPIDIAYNTNYTIDDFLVEHIQ